MGNIADSIVAKLAGLHEGYLPPDTDQRVAAFWWGVQDEEVGWALSLANIVAADEVSQHLYIASVTEDVRAARVIKEWGYRAAVEFVGSKGSGQRKRSMVESYRAEWGHQAARDGLVMAMWPHLSGDVPGIGKRCEAFHCGKQAYQRVRDEVQRQACDLIAGFRLDVAECLAERFSRDFIARWETATGRQWAC